MKRIAFILLAVICLSFAACAGTPYTRYQPQAVTDNPIGTKVGTAPTSPTGIQEAARNAGITRIATVDIREVNNGRRSTYEYIVSGE